jgi:hypothetical protein
VASAPSLYHITIPAPLADQSEATTTVRYIPLNRTSTPTDILELHTKTKYKNYAPYEGAFHPFHGWVQKYGLALPFAYVLYVFNLLPSWAFMVAISFFTRQFV